MVLVEGSDKHIEMFLQQLQECLDLPLVPCFSRANPPYPSSAAPALGHHCSNSRWTPPSHCVTPSPSTSSPAPQPKTLLSRGAPSWVFCNTMSREENSLSQPSPSSIVLLLSPRCLNPQWPPLRSGTVAGAAWLPCKELGGDRYPTISLQGSS